MYLDFSDESAASIIRVTELGSCGRATWTVLIILHDLITQNKAVCQYGISEKPEGGLRIRLGI
jgi:hypothetical protein